MPRLILASSSPYRRQLLERLALPFETRSPDIDETPMEGESPRALVQRLAREKARAVAAGFDDALVIGSDQVAVLQGKILGKPGSHENALAQLRRCSGRAVMFQTGLCLIDTASGVEQLECVPFEVRFRALSEPQIERYLQQEKPYDSAGSFKSEGLGIALFESMYGDDPTALVGLPLIRLTRMLDNAGVELP